MKNLLTTLLISIAFISTAHANWSEGERGDLLMTLGNKGDNHIGLICEPLAKRYSLLFREPQLADTEDNISATFTVDQNDTFELVDGWMMPEMPGRVFFTLDMEDAITIIEQFTKGIDLTLNMADTEYAIDLIGFTANSQQTINACL